METPDRWEGRENERLSRYDEGNEAPSNDDLRQDYSLSEAESEYSKTGYTAPEPQTDEERYSNSYGSNSDGSRTLLTRGNEMVFENDHEGQEYDDSWDAANRDNQPETYEEERRRLDAQRRQDGFNTEL